jgi:hypothetical protein
VGQLAGISLADGSMLDYVRNGQNQVTAIARNRIATPWLRWLLPQQNIVDHLQRDAVGLNGFTYGNGIVAHYRRSKEGALAGLDYRLPRAQPGAANVLGTAVGISAASAASTEAGLPADPAIEHRYLWDLQGNLWHGQGKDGGSSYACDAHDRLIASAGRCISCRIGPAASTAARITVAQ